MHINSPNLKKLDFSKLTSKHNAYNAILASLETSPGRNDNIKTSANSPRQHTFEGHSRTKSMGLIIQPPYNINHRYPYVQEVIEISRPESKSKEKPSLMHKYSNNDDLFRPTSSTRTTVLRSREQTRPGTTSSSRMHRHGDSNPPPQFILMNYQTSHDLYRSESPTLPDKSYNKLYFSAKERVRKESAPNTPNTPEVEVVRALKVKSPEPEIKPKPKKSIVLFLSPKQSNTSRNTQTPSYQSRKQETVSQKSPTLDLKLVKSREGSRDQRKGEEERVRKVIRGVGLSKNSEYTLIDRQKAVNSIVNNRKNLKIKLDPQSTRCFQELKESIGMSSAERPYTSLYQNYCLKKNSGMFRQNVYLIQDICKDVGVMKRNLL